MGYDPENPMKDRITDIGPPHFEQFFHRLLRKITANGCIMKFLNLVY